MILAAVLGPAFSVLRLLPEPVRYLCDMSESLVGRTALNALDHEFEARNWF
jgi:hypothetical protein